MASNEQVLVREIIQQEHSERAADMSKDMFFQFFVTQLLMKKFDLSDEEIEDGITDGGNDGGCDGIYIFVNDELIHEDDDVAEKYRRNCAISLVIIQAKNSSGFSEDSIMKWKTLSDNLLDLNFKIADYNSRYKDDVLKKMDLFRDVYIKLVRKCSLIEINYYYVANATETHPNVKAQAEELKALAKSKHPSAKVNVIFVDSKKIVELSTTHGDSKMLLQCNAILNATDRQEYITLVSLSNYFKFITNQYGELIRYIFESNVRDYQGKVAVNQQIYKSLQAKSQSEDFWWLNNGVTIVAQEAIQNAGNKLMILNPEIVNGLQTSTEIFRYFTDNQNDIHSDERNLLVRIVIPQSDEARDRIILATNSQTAIPKSSLRASDIIHRQIEMYFKPKELYYDRRKNYYKNQGKPIDKIISIGFLAQCLISTLLQQPDYARARPSTLLEKDSIYKKLFNDKIDLDAYYVIAHVGRKVQITLKRTPDISRNDKTNILFYTVFAYMALLVENTSITAESAKNVDIINLRDEDIQKCIRIVLDIYIAKGANDKLAKNRSMTEAVTAIINEQLAKESCPNDRGI